MTAARHQLAAITALVRDKGDKADLLLKAAAKALKAEGLTVAGALQEAQKREEGCCDDFSLYNLATGNRYKISQDLGRGSRGCRLDYGNLAAALADLERGLSAGTNALILNRFGYSESRGGGFRPLIERAVELEIPVLLAINRKYYDAWRDYAGEISCDLEATSHNTMEWYCAIIQASARSFENA